MMNILVTGANGQLGRSLRNVAKHSVDNYIFADIVGEDIVKLDITNPDAVNRFVDDNDIELIINCAAYTNVEKAEDEPQNARLLNADAVGILANTMQRRDGWLIHISTDYVFGGTFNNTPCSEDMETIPTGAYGRTKLEGEVKVKESGCKYLIFRTAWLYSEYGNNFVKTMLRLTAEKPEIKVVVDQVGTPTYAGDLAGAIFDIIENRKFVGNQGIYNYSNEGVCSWYDFAVAIATLAEHHSCRILPCLSDEFPSKVKRPHYSVLDKTKVKTTFGVRVPHWTTSLRSMLCKTTN